MAYQDFITKIMQGIAGIVCINWGLSKLVNLDIVNTIVSAIPYEYVNVIFALTVMLVGVLILVKLKK